MKIIDEKARLFGKINILDAMVIIFLMSLAPVLFFAYRVFKEKKSYSAQIKDMPVNKSLKNAINEVESRINYIDQRVSIVEDKIVTLEDRLKIKR